MISHPPYLQELNAPQLKAATHCDGPLLILAGAGSGKTKTLISRMTYLIREKKISPENILSVTFTNKAAKEMKERIQRGIPGKKIRVGTFHSQGIYILREFMEVLERKKTFSIFDQGDQLSLIRTLLRNIRSDKKFDAKVFLGLISFAKNRGFRPETIHQIPRFQNDDPYHQILDLVFDRYQRQLAFYNAVDFDDILRLSNEILATSPEAKKKLTQNFQYLMVDEFQDTNLEQLQFVKHLSEEHRQVCVVGDDDQSIYSFRGAVVENILNFPKLYPQTTIIKLEQNYRSTQEILNLANDVIAINIKRHPKSLWSHKQGATPVYLWATQDPEHEAQIIIEDITRRRAQGNTPKIAILFRSINQITALEDQLKLSGLPYQLSGGQKFIEKKEIKDILSYLTLVINQRNEEALRRIINYPARGIGEKTLDQLLQIAHNSNRSLFSVIDHLPEKKSLSDLKQLIQKYSLQLISTPAHDLPQFISAYLEELKYIDAIRSDYQKIANGHKILALKEADISRLINFSGYFKDEPSARDALFALICRLQLQDSSENSEDLPAESIPSIQMMSLHGAKGLEFEVVYLPSLEEEFLPHKKAGDNLEGIAEERRLFYVGITRAQSELIMSYCKKRIIFGKEIMRRRTRFLKDVPESLYTFQDRTKFDHLTEEETKQYKKDFLKNLISSL